MRRHQTLILFLEINKRNFFPCWFFSHLSLSVSLAPDNVLLIPRKKHSISTLLTDWYSKSRLFRCAHVTWKVDSWNGMEEKNDSFQSIFKPYWRHLGSRLYFWLGLYVLRLVEKSNLLESWIKTYLWSFKHRSHFVWCWWALLLSLYGNLPNLAQVFKSHKLAIQQKHIFSIGFCLISQFIPKISETVTIVVYRTHTRGYIWFEMGLCMGMRRFRR